jgi:hypothetical protein
MATHVCEPGARCSSGSWYRVLAVTPLIERLTAAEFLGTNSEHRLAAEATKRLPNLNGAAMFEPATQSEIDRYDHAVASAIATCGGDLRGAIKALIIANEYLERELGLALDSAAPRSVLRACAAKRHVA